MPSYLDLGLLAVVLVSALLSMVRGFTREVLAILSWAAAAAAALYFYPLLLPTLKPYIQKDTIAIGVAAGAIFLVTLIVVSVITVKLSDAILDSKVGALDRTLGFVFGAARGLLLGVVAFLFFNWLVPEKTQPEWVKTARTKPLLQATGDQLMAVLPDDPDSTFLSRLKRKPAPGDDTPVDPDSELKAPPPANIPPARPGAGKKTEATPAPAPAPTYALKDRKTLDAMLSGAAAPKR